MFKFAQTAVIETVGVGSVRVALKSVLSLHKTCNLGYFFLLYEIWIQLEEVLYNLPILSFLCSAGAV
ncbi:MAG TPA: hypothetical protein PLQ98_03040, partial [Bacillota bacterium]|nr:hypothetical protein [Bacillota bacterium]